MNDTATIDGILAALYRSFRAPAGARDFSSLRALFRPDARLVRCVDGLEELTVERFLRATAAFYEDSALYERELVRRVDRFGNVAHVFSSYEARLEPDGPPLARGVNALQLVHDGHRWWVSAMAWDDEGPDRPLPPELVG
jgi:hypothetical protein